MPTAKITEIKIKVGRRAFTVEFFKERILHPRLNRQRNATCASLVNDTGTEIGFAYTLRKPTDKNNPTYAQSTAFRRAVDDAFRYKNIRNTTRVALFNAFFGSKLAAA